MTENKINNEKQATLKTYDIEISTQLGYVHRAQRQTCPW